MTSYRDQLKARRLNAAAAPEPSPAAPTAPAALPPLVSQADIARRYGVSRAAVAQWLPLDGWPRPVIEAGRTRLWDAAEVDQWVGQRRGHGPK